MQDLYKSIYVYSSEIDRYRTRNSMYKQMRCTSTCNDIHTNIVWLDIMYSLYLQREVTCHGFLFRVIEVTSNLQPIPGPMTRGQKKRQRVVSWHWYAIWFRFIHTRVVLTYGNQHTNLGFLV